MSKSGFLVPTLAQLLIRETKNRFTEFHVSSDKEINKNQKSRDQKNKKHLNGIPLRKV